MLRQMCIVKFLIQLDLLIQPGGFYKASILRYGETEVITFAIEAAVHMAFDSNEVEWKTHTNLSKCFDEISYTIFCMSPTDMIA